MTGTDISNEQAVWTIQETSVGPNSPDVGVAEALAATSARRIRLVLAGHHPLMLCGLAHVLETQGNSAVTAICTELDLIVDTVRRHQPDIVILDLDRTATFKVLRPLGRANLQARIVVLAAASDDGADVDAMRLGVDAVLFKELSADAFVAAIRKVLDGGPSGGDHNGARLVKVLKAGLSQRHRVRQLTPRETEIAQLAVLGISTRKIAARLNVKPGTVKIHLHSIYEKLNVGGRLGLILFAQRHGLV